MTDDDLRARLQRADPAASLPPLAPGTVERLLGETMTTTAITANARWWRLAVVAAVVILVATGIGYLFARPGNPAPPESVAPLWATSPAVTDLTATGTQAKCAEPEAARLAEAADFAFAGSVINISGKVVALRVTHVYRGAATDEVRVAQQGDISETILGGGTFETGKDYLVASSGGEVLICGYSGEADSPGLRELYDQAF